MLWTFLSQGECRNDGSLLRLQVLRLQIIGQRSCRHGEQWRGWNITKSHSDAMESTRKPNTVYFYTAPSGL